MKQGKITTKERDKIVLIVKKKLYPIWAAIFMAATKDVLKISGEDMNKILKYLKYTKKLCYISRKRQVKNVQGTFFLTRLADSHYPLQK